MTQQCLPSAKHLAWADCEIGVIIHHDMQVYEPGYTFRENRDYQPPAERFNPSDLNTDQWMETAAAMGATYAVLVAKHCSGFSLWPTKAHDYSVAASPWKGGKGDVVADFIASCKRFNIRPGLYASVGCNAFLGVDGNKLVGVQDPERWSAYVETVKCQLRELWTNYGELFEIWFDGGNLPADQGGEEISELLLELQPNAVVFQGDPERMQTVRWIGNERAVAPYPCWSTTHLGTSSGGDEEEKKECHTGSPDGSTWCPGEADMPNRDQTKAFQGGWFWQPGEDEHLYPAEELLERYYSSVGRNCNFLLGMVIDDRGLVPEADVDQMTQLGELVTEQFSNPRGRTAGSGFTFEIQNPHGEPVTMVCLKEELTQGERIQRFTLTGIDGETVVPLASGSCVGHCFLERFAACSTPAFRLTIEEASDTPSLREFSLWQTKDLS